MGYQPGERTPKMKQPHKDDEGIWIYCESKVIKSEMERMKYCEQIESSFSEALFKLVSSKV